MRIAARVFAVVVGFYAALCVLCLASLKAALFLHMIAPFVVMGANIVLLFEFLIESDDDHTVRTLHVFEVTFYVLTVTVLGVMLSAGHVVTLMWTPWRGAPDPALLIMGPMLLGFLAGFAEVFGHRARKIA